MTVRSNGSSMKAEGDIRRLLMFRILRLATIAERSGQLRVSREFGLNLSEWRALGLIHALEPVPLAGLAAELYLDKGQISRSVSDLIRKGLVSHSASLQDRRQTLFGLTAEGRRLHGRVLAFTTERNAIVTQFLSAREKAELSRLLDKVTKAEMQAFEEVFHRQTKQAADRDASEALSRSKTAATRTPRERLPRETPHPRRSRASGRVRKSKSAGLP